MSRIPLPLHTQDISAFARSLGSQLAARGAAPSHLELLNMLARSGGFKNFQHLRALARPERPEKIEAPAQPVPQASQVSPERLKRLARLARLARLFDAEGRLVRWPSKRGLEQSCLWVMWSRVPARRDMSEPELREVLALAHTFGDHALLRRGLCDLGLMTRTPDGRVYRRVEARPTDEAGALLELLRQRRGQ